jgi:hypothetical protein
MSSVFEKYEPYLALLDFRDVTPLEAERTAEKCFHAQALIVRDLAMYEYKELVTVDAAETIEAELLTTVPSEFKNAETRKAWVQTRPGRKEASDKANKAIVATKYLVRLLRLFEQAANLYGQKARR